MSLGNITADRRAPAGLPSGTTGALITDVDPNGSAARSGLRAGDVILTVNRVDVRIGRGGSARAAEGRVGRRTAFLRVWRQNQEIFVTIRKE